MMDGIWAEQLVVVDLEVVEVEVVIWEDGAMGAEIPLLCQLTNNHGNIMT